mgnify:CR=1 FL=1
MLKRRAVETTTTSLHILRADEHRVESAVLITKREATKGLIGEENVGLVAVVTVVSLSLLLDNEPILKTIVGNAASGRTGPPQRLRNVRSMRSASSWSWIVFDPVAGLPDFTRLTWWKS